MNNIVVQPEVIKALADCVVDIITNKIDWSNIDWQAVAEKACQRPTGEWVEELTLDRWVQELPSVYYCSRCRSEPFGDNLYRYCPNCGARMNP